jgi:hypothetical protein
MLHINHDTKYFWYQDVMDFRNGFGGLSGLIGEHIRKEVTDGGVLKIVNRRRNAIKLHKWDDYCLAIYHKRLESGLFETPVASSDGRYMRISNEQLSLILHGL